MQITFLPLIYYGQQYNRNRPVLGVSAGVLLETKENQYITFTSFPCLSIHELTM